MRILFLSGWYPYPADNGSKLRILNLLQGLMQHHEVSLLSFADRPEVEPNTRQTRKFYSEVQIVPWKPYNPRSRRARLGFLSAVPRSMIDTYSTDMAQCIEQTISRRNYDLVIASQLGMARYRRHFKQMAALFEEAEVGLLFEQFSQARSVWGRARHGLTWAKHRTYLARLLRHFGACTVVSDQERQLLARIVPDYRDIQVIPNGVSLADYRDVPKTLQPNNLIFTGSFRYFANYEAMTWFLRDIYPRIRAQAPDAHLTVTGDHANQPLPSTDGVTLTGIVDDVRPLVASAAVSLVPIQVGGGTRLKILEAMALRTPVVATSKGAEGLEVKHGDHLLIADTPQEFAEAVLCLLGDPSLGRRLADNAYRLAREKYDWAAVMPRFLDLIERVAHV
jgi:glycosyltransferase involved in cell wall biosynthesis